MVKKLDFHAHVQIYEDNIGRIDHIVKTNYYNKSDIDTKLNKLDGKAG